MQLAVLAAEVPPDPPFATAVALERALERAPGPFPRSRDGWLRLAEDVVGDWTATLRAALILVLLFAGMVMSIGLAFGFGSAAAATAVGFLVFLAGRRRDDAAPE